jgi:cellulose synthase (UDP-forming)
MRLQYLLSCSYFLTGWTMLVYMSFPVIRILTGEQPLASTAADQFLIHFVPYFGLALWMVAMMGSGTYTFRAFALQAASFWIHVHASLAVLLRRPGTFKVTPKRGAEGRQPRAVLPALVAIATLVGVSAYGLWLTRDPGTLNNVAFSIVHVWVLSVGVGPALRGAAATADEPAAARAEQEERRAA